MKNGELISLYNNVPFILSACFNRRKKEKPLHVALWQLSVSVLSWYRYLVPGGSELRDSHKTGAFLHIEHWTSSCFFTTL